MLLVTSVAFAQPPSLPLNILPTPDFINGVGDNAEGWPVYVFAAAAILGVVAFACAAACTRATHLRKHGLLDNSLAGIYFLSKDLNIEVTTHPLLSFFVSSIVVCDDIWAMHLPVCLFCVVSTITFIISFHGFCISFMTQSLSTFSFFYCLVFVRIPCADHLRHFGVHYDVVLGEFPPSGHRLVLLPLVFRVCASFGAVFQPSALSLGYHRFSARGMNKQSARAHFFNSVISLAHLACVFRYLRTRIILQCMACMIFSRVSARIPSIHLLSLFSILCSHLSTRSHVYINPTRCGRLPRIGTRFRPTNGESWCRRRMP